MGVIAVPFATLAAFGLVPEAVTFENWTYLLSKSRLPRWFFNSVFVSTIHTFLQLFICSLAAYAFARIRFIGSRVLFPVSRVKMS